MGEDRGRMTEDWGRRGFAVFKTGAGLTSGPVFALLMTGRPGKSVYGYKD